MKKLNLLASAILLVATVVSCGVDIDNKEPRHRGEKDIKITSIKCDTVYMDGSSLSLEGSWIMKEDTLVWFDKYTHGAHLFSMDGNYITRRIEKGDGPNDMKTYPWAVCADGNDGIIILDANNMLHHYDKMWQKRNKAFYFQRGNKMSNEEWEDLYNNPNPETPYMYEYNFNVGRLAMVDDSTLIIPAITEHVKFNGYSPSMGSVEYWQKAYNFMGVNMCSSSPNTLFGHFPAVYREKNMPVFSSYDLAVKDENIYVAYAADSLIYVMDKTGHVSKMIGYASALGDTNYPVTLSFDEAEENMGAHLKKYGRYMNVYAYGDYIFRTYVKEDKTGYGLQVYKGDDMVGDIPMDTPMRIVGYKDDVFYAFLSPDKEKDLFRMVKFRL